MFGATHKAHRPAPTPERLVQKDLEAPVASVRGPVAVPFRRHRSPEVRLWPSAAKQAAEKYQDGVMLSEAKNLLFIRDIENKSRFFSPTNNVGLQNDNHLLFSAASKAAGLEGSASARLKPCPYTYLKTSFARGSRPSHNAGRPTSGVGDWRGFGVRSSESGISSQDGFSLLELIIVMAILVSVSGIVLAIMFRMSMAQGTVSNRTEMHASVRSATEVLQQEIGQAGRVALPGVLTSPPTLSNAVVGNATSQTPGVSSSAGMFPGELLIFGPDVANGAGTETAKITGVGTNTLTAVFMDPHAAGAPVTVAGTFASGVIPPRTNPNCLGAGNVCTVLSWDTSTSLPVITNLSAAQASSDSILKLYGDVNGDGNMVYVEYWCDTVSGNFYRNVMPLTAAAKPAVSSAEILLPNILDNPDGTPCFDYQVKAVGNDTYVINVAVTLTVQTQFRDPQTNQFQTETKALLNVSPRNVFEAWQMASAGVTKRLQHMPATVLALAGQPTQ